MPNLRQLRVRKASRPFLNKTSDDVIVNTNDSAPLYKADTTHAGVSPDCITIPDKTYEGCSQAINTTQIKKSLSRCRMKNGSKEAKVLDQSCGMSKMPVLSDMLLKSTNKSAHLQKLKGKIVKVTDPKKRKSETLITTRSKQPRLDVTKVGTTQSNTSCLPVDKTNLKEPFMNKKSRNMIKEKEKKSHSLHQKTNIPKTGPSNYLIPEQTQASILRPQYSGSVTIKTSNESDSTSLVTVDSSSDSDFEEVHTSYRTHNVTCTTEICKSVSDYGANQKLADSFTDFDDTQHPNRIMISNIGMVKQCYGHKTNITKSDKKSTSSKQTSKEPMIKKKGKRQGTEVAVKEKNTLGKNENHKRFQTMTVKTDGDMPIHSDMDVMTLLMKMEGRVKSDANGAPTAYTSISKNNISAIDSAHHSESEEDSDWEEVEDLKHSPMKSQIPIGPVEIIIDDPSLLHRKRRKKEFDWKAYIQRRINRLAREIQVDMHKVHLLCLLSLGMLQNQIFNDMTLGAVALSHIPAEHFKRSIAKQDSQSLLSIVRWFQEKFSLSSTPKLQNLSLVRADKLFEVLEKKTSDEWRHLVMILVIILRAMGFRVRFVMSLQVLPLKMSQTSARKSVPKKSNKISEHGVEDDLSTKDANTKSTKKASTTAVTSSKQKAPKLVRKKTKLVQSSKQSTEPTKKNVIIAKKNQQSKKPKLSDPVFSSSGGDDVKDDDDDDHLPAKRRSSRRKRAVKTSLFPDDDLEGELRLTSCSDEGSNFSDDSLVKNERNKGKRLLPHKSSQEQDKNENSEDEFEQSVSVCRPLRKYKKPKPKNKKILSSSSSDTSLNESWRSTKAGQDCWLEVLLESNQRWICVDYTKCLLGKPYEIAAAASQPLLYVLSFDNNGCIKDVTPKYAVNWMSHTRKQRVDTSWWNDTLEAYASQNIKLDDLENEEIRVQLMQRPLPTSVSEFKNHPLYALSRHLLKFEAIYPETSIPVGFFRQEPVYARESVHVLHSRDNWLKEGRTVRIGESAYKKVKSRKRWKRPRDDTDELDLELFGHWQTEEYIPPPAVNGKVPKNEYGNIELFQPSMLPAGTVHLRVPALNRVAKKLNIDIAAAMVGWDHHCGYSHPVLDGWVVCKEHEDVLMTAWQQDQEIQRQREAEKRKKRVLNNWTTLTRGLLIKEKLKKKFNLEEKKTSKKKITQKMDGEVATDLQHSWPAKQQQKKGKQNKTESQPAHYTIETM